MNNDRLKDLLARLHDELEGADVDADTRSMLEALDADIHELLEEEGDDPAERPVLEQAGYLRGRFATEHPVAERFMREIIDTLVKLGV